MEQRPKVGIGILVLRGNEVLLAKRKNAHGAGQYAFPGGHLEYLESFESCALREIAEECGVKVKNLRFQYLANIKVYADTHYTHIGLLADWHEGEPQLLEPHKAENWGWYALESLPEPLFEPCRLAFLSLKSGINYFDS